RAGDRGRIRSLYAVECPGGYPFYLGLSSGCGTASGRSRKKITTSSNTSLPTFTARWTGSLGSDQSTSPTAILQGWVSPPSRNSRLSRSRLRPRSPDERGHDARVLPPPATAFVAGPSSFRDDATPADLLSAPWGFSIRRCRFCFTLPAPLLASRF